MQEINKSISFDGRDIRLRTGLLAPQAGGCVLIEAGETAVIVTATRGTSREGIDFLPLVVDYEERLYAAGRIPGGFLRREGRPPEKAILTGRLIDRPLRPLFPHWIREEIQIVSTTVSLDERVPPDILAVTGASFATLLAQIPFYGPMAAVRVGLIGDDFVINPTYLEIERGDLDMVVAGSPEGVIMVEAGANQLPELDIIEAIEFGYEAVQELIRAQGELLTELGITYEKPVPPKPTENLVPPRWQHMLVLGVSGQHKGWKWSGEGALSQLDNNRFSTLQKGDDHGYSYALELERRTALRRREKDTLWLKPRLKMEQVSAHFAPFVRFRAVEFSRDWNLVNRNSPNGSLQRSPRGIDYLPQAEITLQKGQIWELGYGLEAYLKGEEYSAWRQKLSAHFNHARWKGKWLASYARVAAPASGRAEFFRQSLELEWNSSWGRIRLKGQDEINPQRSWITDSLDRASMVMMGFRILGLV